MKPTGLGSFALVVTAAALFTTSDAHGKTTVPTYRQMSEKCHKDSGALINIGLNEMQIAPIEGLSQHKQADFPPSATFNLQNGCRGTVYEEANEVTTIQPGSEFDVKWKIEAPHPGYMKLSILKPSEDSKGVITYKSYKTLLNIEPFAENGGEDGTTAKMPTDVEGCDKPGDCVLHGGDTSTTTKVTTAPTAASSETSDTGSSAQTTPSSVESAGGSSDQSTPSSNTTPSANTTPTAPTPTTAAPEATTATAPSTSTTDSSVAGDSDTSKCARRMRRH
ncbi:hypothetical protein PI124_g6931 [Phytophthora idaei]|nr:hypothetical protein PI125_g7871 [Phytophthora idaei]KAG3157557.1 hypothetical protein PI126_g8284 [Phytophthora idaei]KAG3248388.1 hypothetical protein PI124_g6931 [Phytophthora idaei]